MTLSISVHSPSAKLARLKFMLAGRELLSIADERDPWTLSLSVMVLTDAAQFKVSEVAEICNVTSMTINRWKIGKNMPEAMPKRARVIAELKKNLDQRIQSIITKKL